MNKKLGLAAGAALLALSGGCAFFGYSGITVVTPSPTPTPTATPAPTPAPTAAPGATPDPAKGQSLWNAKSCEGCHASSTKKGKTRAQLDAAISGNLGGMGSLSTLTDTERDDLAAYMQSL